jgi:hypothetical protein
MAELELLAAPSVLQEHMTRLPAQARQPTQTVLRVQLASTHRLGLLESLAVNPVLQEHTLVFKLQLALCALLENIHLELELVYALIAVQERIPIREQLLALPALQGHALLAQDHAPCACEMSSLQKLWT